MADKKTGLEIVVSATDRATAKFKEINKKLANSGLGKLNNSLRLLKGASGLNQVGKAMGNFGRATSNAANEFQGLLFKVGALVGLGGGGLFALSKGFADFSDNVQDSADRLGVGVEAYQRLSITAGLAGVNQEVFNSSLDRFSKNIGEASVKGGDVARVFSRWGLPTKDLKNFDRALPLAIQKLSGMRNAAVRNALGVKLFGKQFGQLVPMIKDFQSFSAQAGGFVLSKEEIERGDSFKRQLEAFTTLLGNIRNLAGAAMVDGFSEGLKILSDFFKENRAEIKEFFTAIGKELPGAFRTLVSALKSVMGFFSTYNSKTGETTLNMGKVKLAFGVFSAFLAGPFLISVGLLIPAFYDLALAIGAAGLSFAIAFPWFTAFVALATLVYAKWEPIKELFKDIVGYIASIGKKWKGVFSSENLRGIASVVMGPAPVAQTNFLQQKSQGPVNATASLSVNVNAPKGTTVQSNNNGFEQFMLTRGYGMSTQ